MPSASPAISFQTCRAPPRMNSLAAAAAAAGPRVSALALVALLRHQPSRRLAYYAALAAVAKIVILHLLRAGSSKLHAALTSVSKRYSAYVYASKYILHVEKHAVAFDELIEPASPRSESRSPLTLPPITEADEAAGSLPGSPAVKRRGLPPAVDARAD